MIKNILLGGAALALLIISVDASHSIDFNSLADQSTFRCSEEVVAVGDLDRDVRTKCGDPLKIARKQDFAQNGDIVVAMIDDEATVKRFYLENGCVKLQPENDNYEPIYTTDMNILGKVIGVLRMFK